MANEPSHGVDATPQTKASDGAGAADPNPVNPNPANPNPANPNPAAADPAAAYRPEGATGKDHLFGASDRETIDKLFGAYEGARAEIAKGKPAIPEAAAYQFNWSDGLKGVIGDGDPAVAEFRAIAHEHGYTQQQIDAIPKLMDKLVEKGLIEKPFDSGKLLEELAPASFKGTPEQRQLKGTERLTAAEAWIKQLGPTHGFDDAMKQELRLFTTTAQGVRVIEAFQKSGMNASVQPGGGQPAAVTKSDLDARVADPRNDAYGPKFDEAFAAETKKLFKEMYPD